MLAGGPISLKASLVWVYPDLLLFYEMAYKFQLVLLEFIFADNEGDSSCFNFLQYSTTAVIVLLFVLKLSQHEEGHNPSGIEPHQDQKETSSSSLGSAEVC